MSLIRCRKKKRFLFSWMLCVVYLEKKKKNVDVKLGNNRRMKIKGNGFREMLD